MTRKNRIKTGSRLVPGAVGLLFCFAIVLPASAKTVTWAGGDGDWDTTTANWLDGATPTTFANGDEAVFDGAGGTITVVGTVEPLTTTVNSSGNYTFSGGVIGGTGTLTKDGTGRLTINPMANTFSGGTFINGGELRMNTQADSALGTGTVTLNDGTFRLERINATNDLIVNGGKMFGSNGFGNSWSGTVTLNADLTVESTTYGGPTKFNGIISGTGGLILTGLHGVELTAANDYTGDTTVNSGILIVGGSSINDANKLLIDGGKVQSKGTEIVNTLFFDTGQQEPGTFGATGSGAGTIDDVHFFGTAGVVQVLTGRPQDEADILSFGLQGAPAVISGTNIAWTVPTGTDVMDLAPIFELSFGAVATPPSGTSRDFTAPQTYSVDSGDGTITGNIYTVTVTVAAVPSTFTWTDPVAGNWSDNSKWTNDLASGTGPGFYGGSSYVLNFTTPGTYTTTHDLPDGLLLNQFNFAAAVTLDSANGVALTADGATLPQINQNSGSGVIIELPVELAADTTLGGTGGGWVTIQDTITGTGSLTMDGTGTLRMKDPTNTNTYSGGTIINSGTLRVDYRGNDDFTTDEVLGTGPVTLNDGTFFLWRVKPTNALTVNGGKLVSSNGFGNDWKGPVSLNTDLLVEPQFKMVFSGVISGVGGLTIDNQTNTVVLAAANDYTGDTVVNSGTLEVNGDSINDEGKLVIDGGKVMPTGTEIVKSLFFGAAKQSAGTWGAAGSGAANIDDTRFTGTAGVIEVPAEDDYTIWAEGYPGADLSDPDADYDGDGVSNDEERLFGLDPTGPGSVNPISVPFDSGAGTLSFTRRDDALTGKFSSVWTSTDLMLWTEDAGAVLIPAAPVDDVETVAVTLSHVLLDAPRLFVQIRQDDGELFAENFDGTDAGSLPAGWTSGKNNPPDSASTTNWELGTPANVGPVPPGVPLPSADNCVATDIDSNYDDPPADDAVPYTDIWLRTPAIDVSVATAGTLSFQQWTEIEQVPGDFDYGSIRILDASDDSVLAVMEDRTIDGTTGGWQTYSMELPAAAFTAAAGTIKVEWRFEADDIDSFAGWYIDDVTVTATAVGP